MTRSTYVDLLRPALLGMAILGIALATGAHAGNINIVQDPGFELADPAAIPGATDYFNVSENSFFDHGIWNVTQGSVGVDTQDAYVFAGQKSVLLNGDGFGPDSLSQTLTTTPGQVYTISFWADANAANSFSLTFGGADVTGIPTSIQQNGFPSPNYLGNSSQFTFYSGTALATSASTELTFTASSPDSTSTVELDNVSVIAAAAVVPEPSALMLAIIGGIGSLMYTWRRRAR